MGCGCKSKSSTKINSEANTSTASKKTLKFKEHAIKIARILVVTTLLTIAIPLIWLLIVYIVIKSYYGEPFDLGGIIHQMKDKGEDDIEEEEINPEDYQLVGVDKID
jgi:hypothetical protein